MKGDEYDNSSSSDHISLCLSVPDYPGNFTLSVLLDVAATSETEALCSLVSVATSSAIVLSTSTTVSSMVVVSRSFREGKKGLSHMMKKWMSLVCLCFALMGVPVAFGACSSASIVDTRNPVTYAANGSVQYPYPLETTKGKCTAWSVVLDPGWGDPLCASSLPTQHVGQYVQVSASGFTQNMAIVSIDPQKKVVHLK
jgi:hypothetical protein